MHPGAPSSPRHARAALVAVAALALAACRRPTTAVLIELDTDAPVDRALVVEALVRRGANPALDAPADQRWGEEGSRRVLPASFSVVPGPGGLADPVVTVQVTAHVTAMGPSAPEITLRRVVRFSFAPATTLRVPVFLAIGCARASTECERVPPEACTVAARCEELGQTCGDDARCVPLDVTPEVVPATPPPDASTQTGPPPCPGARVRCGAVCVDLASDPEHCGACDRACPLGCVAGACAAPAALMVRDLNLYLRTTAGALFATGQNATGVLLPRTDTPIARAARLRDDLAAGLQFAPAEQHACVLRADRRVACWGGNERDALAFFGAAAPSPRLVPDIPALARLFPGDFTVFGQDASGAVWAWGSNTSGIFGDGTRTMVGQAAAGPVPALRGARVIVADQYHACALDSNGAPVCWGENGHGEVGDGTLLDRLTPTPIAGLLDVAEFALGLQFTCARRGDGAVLCWGLNGTGQLGDGTTLDRARPALVAGLTDARAIAAGENSAYAIVGDAREVYAWGRNAQYELGLGDTTNRSAPTRVPGLRDIVQLGAGYRHACALRADGAVLCWGYDHHSQLGGPPGELVQRPREMAW